MKFIPNFVTLLNLCCGLLGIYCAFKTNLTYSSYFIGAALIFDFLDGFLARLLHVKSEIGKQLDSLADLVTFGVLPAVMLLQYLLINNGAYFSGGVDFGFEFIPPLLLVSCAAYRLAIFNVSTNQSNGFIGIPTPAVAMFIGSFPIVLEYQLKLNYYTPFSAEALANATKTQFYGIFDNWLIGLFYNPTFHWIVAIVMAFLMVSNIKMIALKFKGLAFADNKNRYILIIAVLLMVIFSTGAYWMPLKVVSIEYAIIPLIIVFYILYSITIHLFSRHEV